MLCTGESILFEPHPDHSSSDEASIWSQDSFGPDNDLHSQSSGDGFTSPEQQCETLLETAPDLITNTVLDRLHDGGRQLSRLHVDLSFETQWVSQILLSITLSGPFFRRSFHAAPSQSIAISSGTWRKHSRRINNQYPTKESSL